MRKPIAADERSIQAKRLFDIGMGKVTGYETFRKYLASIPRVPRELRREDLEFLLLTLVDPRVDTQALCRMMNVVYLDSHLLVPGPRDERHASLPEQPFWIRANDGYRNHNRTPRECLVEVVDPIYAATALVGLMIFAQHPLSLVHGEHSMDLPGTVMVSSPSYMASLSMRSHMQATLNLLEESYVGGRHSLMGQVMKRGPKVRGVATFHMGR